MTEAKGFVRPGFERVAEAFERNLQTGELGAACSIRVGGETVVDLWGGRMRSDSPAPWERDTMVTVFSVTKGVGACVVLHLADQGLLDLDAPVARYWPEFGAEGKDQVTVREALGHRAGVPFISGDITLDDLRSPEGMSARLAAEKPIFEPNSAHLYHPLTIGWITSELVRRTTGLTIGQWLAKNIAEPNDLSLHIGVPEAKLGKVARVQLRDQKGTSEELAKHAVEGSAGWKALTLNGLISIIPGGEPYDLNRPEVQVLELAGAGMVADARSLAAFYSTCIDEGQGTRLLSDAIIANATRPISTGLQFGDSVPGPAWGAGVMVPWPIQPMLSETSFGHDGFGGNLAIADPRYGVGFAYIRNSLPPGGVVDQEVYSVVDALRSILD